MIDCESSLNSTYNMLLSICWMNGWNVGSVKNYLQSLISPTIFRLHCFIICCVLSLLFQDRAHD
jgi:Na+/H+ antiporter NhaC